MQDFLDPVEELDRALDEEKKYLSIRQQEHDKLIARLAGVKDEVLRETLQQEYIDLDEELSIQQVKIKELEAKLLSILVDRWQLEQSEFDKQQFEQISGDVLELIDQTNGTHIKDFAIKNRYRIVNSFQQKRELCFILLEFKATLQICSLDLKILETIGKNTDLLLKLYTDNTAFYKRRTL